MWLNWLTGQIQAERRRWILWTPVPFGTGIALYFSLSAEPPAWIGPLLGAAALLAAFRHRHRDVALFPALALLLLAGGFSVACWRAHSVAAPVLATPTGRITLEGRVIEVEAMDHGVSRLILDTLRWPEQATPDPAPERVRIRLRRGEGDWSAGQRLTMAVSLMPPPPPMAPGAFDFARQAWFQGIGAVGYTLDRPRLLESGPAGEGDDRGGDDWGDRIRFSWSALRHGLTQRIQSAIDDAGIGSGSGAVAAALITGERGPVAPDLLQAYRDAGLAHVLVIAGMHMSMVAGLVFVWLRAALAAIPPLALRLHVKKWTAAGALLVILAYLVISGAPVPTRRAFIMNGIVLLAVLFDRDALSLRSITWAALAILAWRPEVLVGASFQMSFAAVYGLISGYEALGPALGRWRRAGRSLWHHIVLYLAGILLTTQIAGTATAFYTIYHFNRYATYGLLGNALAVPLVGFWVMPSALAAFCLMPFGLDHWGWRSMGRGLLLISRIARWVSSLPGASIDLPAVPMAALVLFSLGGLWLVLWKRGWRLLGVIGLAGGVLLYAFHRPPDLLISGSGGVIAVRAADGGLVFSPGVREKALRETWARLAGQGGEPVPWYQRPDAGLACDRYQCRFAKEDRSVLFLFRPGGPATACPSSGLMISGLPSPPGSCPGVTMIDAAALRRDGAHALRWRPDGIDIITVRQWQGRRLWSGAQRPALQADVDLSPK